MGRNLEFDSRVLELNSRFLPKASLPLCLGYSLPKKEKKFLTTALSIVAPHYGVHCAYLNSSVPTDVLGRSGVNKK